MARCGEASAAQMRRAAAQFGGARSSPSDVHHGNGTVAAFMDEPRVLVCSSFQFPHYPYRLQTVERPNIVNTPLPAGTGGLAFRQALERDWLPALESAKPELVLVSAVFDAHRDDPLGDLLPTEADFAWATRLIVDAAAQYAGGRFAAGFQLVKAADNLWTIGTVGQAPHPVVISRRLKNVPETGIWGWDNRWTLAYHPATWYFEEAE